MCRPTDPGFRTQAKNVQNNVRAVLLFGSLMLCSLTLSAKAQEDSATATVEHLHTVILQIMQEADKLGYSGRYRLVEPAVNAGYDFRAMARIVLGSHWNTLTESQINQFTQTFARLAVATYADRFDGYSGEKFETVGSSERQGRYLVKTNLVKNNGETVSLNYMLHKNSGKWSIINVIADGVSDLALKRGEYTSVIKSEGFQALVDKLNEKIKLYETN